jgi:YfiH family protein
MTLPSASPGFHWSDSVCGPVLIANELATTTQHLFTTKQLQLLAPVADEAWTLVANAFGTDVERLVRVKQVHGRTVLVVRDGDLAKPARDARPAADAIVSDAVGSVLAVQVADCVPVLLADPRAGVAAAVHAGWRGSAAHVVGETIAAFSREFGSEPRDLVAVIGPSIGPCCYEVGAELIDSFRDAGFSEADLQRWFVRDVGRLRLDLWTANRDQLVAAGVAASNVSVAQLCTKTHADVFHSYRAEGPRAGRVIAAIRVPART